VERLFASLAAQRTASFRYGIARGTPTLSPRDYTATGIIDFEGARVRMVTVSLPAEFMRSLSVRPRNPLRRVAFAGIRALFHRLAVAREVCYWAGRVSVRDSPGAAWDDVPAGADEGRPPINNPAWIVELLRAPPAAVHVRSEEPEAEDGLRMDIAIDLSLIEDGLPGPLAQDLRGSKRERLTRTPMHICLSAQRIPTRLAISTGVYEDTGDDGWSVLEFTSYGSPFEGPDLWREWRGIAPEPTTSG
jgi:hypothetical protein